MGSLLQLFSLRQYFGRPIFFHQFLLQPIFLRQICLCFLSCYLLASQLCQLLVRRLAREVFQSDFFVFSISFVFSVLFVLFVLLVYSVSSLLKGSPRHPSPTLVGVPSIQFCSSH